LDMKNGSPFNISGVEHGLERPHKVEQMFEVRTVNVYGEKMIRLSLNWKYLETVGPETWNCLQPIGEVASRL
jgi:hypothetical protein